MTDAGRELFAMAIFDNKEKWGAKNRGGRTRAKGSSMVRVVEADMPLRIAV